HDRPTSFVCNHKVLCIGKQHFSLDTAVVLLCETRGDTMKLIASALLFAAMALPAGDPPGLFVWKSAELKGFSKSLAPKIDAKKVATQPLPAFGNYSFMVAHREGSGDAEYHE